MFLLRDFLRLVRRDPAYVASGIALLSVGIGAAVALFAFGQRAVAPLPYSQPDSLVLLRENIPKVSKTYASLPANIRHVLRWQQNSQTLQDVAWFLPATFSVGAQDAISPVGGLRVSSNFFRVLGLTPARGRTFEEREDGSTQVAIVSDDYWRQQLGADPAVIGRSIIVDGERCVIVGVLDSRFYFPRNDQLGAPMVLPSHLGIIRPATALEEEVGIVGDFEYGAIGRLAHGASVPAVNAELDAVLAGIVREYELPFELLTVVEPLKRPLIRRVEPTLWLLAVVGVAGLLLVCANLTGLAIARASARSRDLAVKRSLGASGTRLFGGLVRETFLLAVSGAAGAWAVASAMVAIVRQAPVDVPFLEAQPLDGWHMLLCAGASATLTFLCVIVPHLASLGAPMADVLHDAVRNVAGAKKAIQRSRMVLVAAQVGVTVVLVASAITLQLSLVRLGDVDTGFARENVSVASFELPKSRYKDQASRSTFYARLDEAVRSRLGRPIGLVDAVPLEGTVASDIISVPDDNRPLDERPIAKLLSANAEYFVVMGISTLRGRSFGDEDIGQPRCILSERAAIALWGHTDVIGRRVRRGENARGILEVVGIVNDTRNSGLTGPLEPAIYVPFGTRAPERGALVLRTPPERAVLRELAGSVRTLDPDVRLAPFRDLGEIIDSLLAERRFGLWLALGAGALALSLATIGVYSVIWYMTSLRSREFAVRKALGATSGRLYALVAWAVAPPVIGGLLAGTGAAPIVLRSLSSFVYGATLQSDLLGIAVAYGVVVCAVLAGLLLSTRKTIAGDPAAELSAE